MSTDNDQEVRRLEQAIRLAREESDHWKALAKSAGREWGKDRARLAHVTHELAEARAQTERLAEAERERDIMREKLEAMEQSNFQLRKELLGLGAGVDEELGEYRTRLAEVTQERDVLTEGCKKLAAQKAEAIAQAAVMREVLEPCLRETRTDPLCSLAVRRVGGEVGYGALMAEASHQWRQTAAGEGAFTSGPCIALVRLALAPDAGRRLLQEVEALRELAEGVRPYICQCDANAARMIAALAKLDALPLKEQP